MAPRAAILLLAIVAVAFAACAPASAQTRLGRLVVTGVVPCNTGTLIDVATSPAFPGGAAVRRQRGGARNDGARRVVRDGDGHDRRAGDAAGGMVDTPLAKCNATLPAAGTLVSNLQGQLSGMLSGVFRLAPAGFSFRMN
ncbi:hypothetical protein EJB05_06683, partial [Eragrostis curvula]